MTALTRFSLANRILIVLITVAVTVFGAVALTMMKTEMYPPLEIPEAYVVVSSPGDSAELMEQEVAVPLESVLSSVDGVQEISSTSTNGHSMVMLALDYDVEVDDAADDIRAAVAEQEAVLPSRAEIEVSVGEGDRDLVMVLGASADEESEDLLAALDNTVVPEIEAVSGVQRVELFGQREEVVEITPDRDDLTEHGLSQLDIEEALERNGVLLPGGQLTEDERTLSLTVGREFDTVGDIAALRLPAVGDVQEEAGAEEADTVRLDDVAVVSMALAETEMLSRSNATEAVSLWIYKDPVANTVDVSQEVSELAPSLADDLGTNGEFIVTVDTSPFIEDSIRGLIEKGVAGLVIAVLLILTFMLSVRTTLVTAVSIPLSLLLAVAALWWSDNSLNIVTLAGLTVAIGRVVDDSIVVLENVKRHLSYGADRLTAIQTAVREVSGAITASTLTTAAVFLPVAFVGGLVGELFRPFGITVALALLASLLVSLTVIPVLAYWFIRSRPADPIEQEQVRLQAQEKERRSLLQRGYVPLVGWVTRRGNRGWRTWRRWVAIAAGLLVLAGTMALIPRLETTYLEDGGQNEIIIDQELPPGTSLETTDEDAREIERVLSDIDTIDTFETTVGRSEGFEPATNRAAFHAVLSPEADMAATRAQVEEQLDDLRDVGEVTVASGIDLGGEEDNTAEVTLSGAETDSLEEGAETVTDLLEGHDAVTRVSSDLVEEEPGIEVVPHNEEAAEYGLTDEDIAAVAEVALGEWQPGSTQVGGREHEVVLAAEERPVSVEELEDYEFDTTAGSVTLGDVADVAEVDRPEEIRRTEGQRSVTLTATVDGADLDAVGRWVDDQLDATELPSGVSGEVGGEAADLASAQTELAMALLASVMIVLLIMVATFRSVVQSLVLLVSVPFAATGAVVALLLTGTAMSVSAMIGLLMLVGIVVTNAIVLIDLINQYRRSGMVLRTAVLEGTRLRLRPVVMTALATIGALVPMALGLGTGSVFISQSLALVVIGGLVSSTVLTLVIVPVLYTMVEELKGRLQDRFGERPAAPSPADA